MIIPILKYNKNVFCFIRILIRFMYTKETKIYDSHIIPRKVLLPGCGGMPPESQQPGRLRQKDGKLEARLGSLVTPCLKTKKYKALRL